MQDANGSNHGLAIKWRALLVFYAFWRCTTPRRISRSKAAIGSPPI